MSLERRALLRALGANLVLTPAKDGMKGAIAKAEELAAATPKAGSRSSSTTRPTPRFTSGPPARKSGTDTAGRVDMIRGRRGHRRHDDRRDAVHPRSKKPDFRAFAVEPVDSPVITGGKAGPHKIQGIGAGFIPKNLDTSLLSGVEKVATKRHLPGLGGWPRKRAFWRHQLRRATWRPRSAWPASRKTAAK